MPRPIYIFDLDNTLALTHHRQHLKDNKADPDRYRKYFAACVDDTPNTSVIATFNLLFAARADIRIWTGRSDEVRKQTIQWLEDYTNLDDQDADSVLQMRRANDMTPDYLLKRQWLDDLSTDELKALVAAFDDRDRVVAMYRQAGVPCFQVAYGDY